MHRYILGIALLIGIIAAPATAQTPTVRLGVCPSCTGEGVEGLILKQTNIPQLVGLNLNILFLNPPDMGGGIASKSLDIEWVGDQPTLSQLANGIPVKIIGYQYDFELRVEAAPGINSLADLKGKKIGTPFGTTAYELSVNTIQQNGLALSDLINVAPTDLGTALSGGQISAMTIWDPLWGIIEATYHTKPLAKAYHTGFVLGRTDFVQNEREATVKYLECQMLAIAFRANHKEEADQRYQTAFNIPVAASHAAEVGDRDYDWKNPEKVSLELQPKDYQDLDGVEKFALGAKLLPHEVDFRAATDMSLWREALARLKASKITMSQIHYISNAK